MPFANDCGMSPARNSHRNNARNAAEATGMEPTVSLRPRHNRKSVTSAIDKDAQSGPERPALQPKNSRPDSSSSRLSRGAVHVHATNTVRNHPTAHPAATPPVVDPPPDQYWQTPRSTRTESENEACGNSCIPIDARRRNLLRHQATTSAPQGPSTATGGRPAAVSARPSPESIPSQSGIHANRMRTAPMARRQPP